MCDTGNASLACTLRSVNATCYKQNNAGLLLCKHPARDMYVLFLSHLFYVHVHLGVPIGNLQVGTQVLQKVIRYLTCEACIALASVLVKGHRYTYFGLVRCPLDENNSSPQNHEHTGILNNH